MKVVTRINVQMLLLCVLFIYYVVRNRAIRFCHPIYNVVRDRAIRSCHPLHDVVLNRAIRYFHPLVILYYAD